MSAKLAFFKDNKVNTKTKRGFFPDFKDEFILNLLNG